ncbi:hypothetical protein SGADD02_02264 [Streptococcus gallolyticus]|uniref:Uncharacterized protein n=1 Tax=Streptococcus gallolyticus TaxID=315405 RepID=A0A139QHP0_9STRE|nr:hypothetical protein SGADD02_02264 [Streptococcus gallolyticus]KXU02037.1 hypothetical protein SGADD03_02232 [Streptococcus gallolyticus]
MTIDKTAKAQAINVFLNFILIIFLSLRDLIIPFIENSV